MLYFDVQFRFGVYLLQWHLPKLVHVSYMIFFSGIHETIMKKVLLLQRFNRVFAQMKQTIIIKIAVNHEFAQCHSVCI